MNYLMSPHEDQKRALVDADHFVQALRHRWPDAELSVFPTARVYVVEWSEQLLHGFLLGGFSRNGQAIGLDGDVRDCAEVALWFRALVGEEPRLWFYDQGYNADVEITPTTTASEIIGAFVDES